MIAARLVLGVCLFAAGYLIGKLHGVKWATDEALRRITRWLQVEAGIPRESDATVIACQMLKERDP